MGKILSVVLGLVVLAAIAAKVLNRGSADPNGSQPPSAPKQQLENVRNAAQRIEQERQQAADEVEKKAFGNE